MDAGAGAEGCTNHGVSHNYCTSSMWINISSQEFFDYCPYYIIIRDVVSNRKSSEQHHAEFDMLRKDILMIRQV